jgi:hypothetical protein
MRTPPQNLFTELEAAVHEFRNNTWWSALYEISVSALEPAGSVIHARLDGFYMKLLQGDKAKGARGRWKGIGRVRSSHYKVTLSMQCSMLPLLLADESMPGKTSCLTSLPL